MAAPDNWLHTVRNHTDRLPRLGCATCHSETYAFIDTAYGTEMGPKPGAKA